MINLKNAKNPMPEQDPIVRAGNFEEVAEGYTEQMADKRGDEMPQMQKKALHQGMPRNGKNS